MRFWQGAAEYEALGPDENLSACQKAVAELSAVPPPPRYANVCGVMLPCRGSADSSEGPASSAFVKTAASTAALHAAALALDAGVPVLLSGPPGCGKSTLISELAAATGNSDMLQLHVDDQIDARALLGAYVCTSVPGEFRWQPGPLLQVRLPTVWLVRRCAIACTLSC